MVLGVLIYIKQRYRFSDKTCCMYEFNVIFYESNFKKPALLPQINGNCVEEGVIGVSKPGIQMMRDELKNFLLKIVNITSYIWWTQYQF